MELGALQRHLAREATWPEIDTAALSLLRGNGKSWRTRYLVSRVLSPADARFRPGVVFHVSP